MVRSLVFWEAVEQDFKGRRAVGLVLSLGIDLEVFDVNSPQTPAANRSRQGRVAELTGQFNCGDKLGHCVMSGHQWAPGGER